MLPLKVAVIALWLTCSTVLASADREVSLPIWQQDSGGYYVHGVFNGNVVSELLVDTGSSYVVLSSGTFKVLKREGAAIFRRSVRGVTAAGRIVETRVYAVSELNLGANCVLRDVEVVALPSADRDILGLSALRRLQSFALSFEPAALKVTGCEAAELAKSTDSPSDT